MDKDTIAGRLKRAATTEVLTVLIGLVSVFGTVLIYAWSAAPPDEIGANFGTLSLFSIAALTCGAAVGFLFGIPRARQLDSNGNPAAADASRFSTMSTIPNTNLEQISDWLTKILVGVTLVQLGNISSGANRLFESMSSALSTGPSAKAVTGSLVVFGTTFGFIFGWLTTRTWIPRWLTASDSEISGQLEEFKSNGNATGGNVEGPTQGHQVSTPSQRRSGQNLSPSDQENGSGPATEGRLVPGSDVALLEA